jgi:hypothetical protein
MREGGPLIRRRGFVALEAGRQPWWVVRIGHITGGAWHTGPAAPASVLATPGAVIVTLANPNTANPNTITGPAVRQIRETGDRPLQARLQPRLMWVSPPACCAPIFGLALEGPCVRVLEREPVPGAARRTAKPQALRRGARRF